MTSTTPPAGSIVVGIDGSAGADQALEWAVDQAALEHRPLTIVYSGRLTTGGDALWLGQPGVDVGAMMESIKVAGHGLLDNAERRAVRRAPGLEVHQVLSTGDPRLALVELGERAAGLVVGSRGRRPIATALLGSVSVHVARHATCPVVVVRHAEGTAPRGGVVVDVDDTEQARAAIEYAYRTASFRSLPLTALRVVWDPEHRRDDEHVVTDADPGLDAERLLLSEATAGMREKFPDVLDRLVLVRGMREHQLTRASRDADLLVLGSHEAGVIDRFVFGSVSTVLEHAACDVALVSGGLTPAM
ncbi:universal stress protein [Nocardioides plantarum]|uniref:Universal stress protein n=1 Tax=Nocardioides plantarum TaxID=29299 RepID=A0ABV5K669_9ACTN|nr:universal stress protein [Nocardioides plantarum]